VEQAVQLLLVVWAVPAVQRVLVVLRTVAVL
jgi:hypothetical protein